jgi:SAM-dependent methyltransferase
LQAPLTYKEAVQRGDYDRYAGNLFGKYDNVRVYWEDQLTRLILRPFLTDLVAQKRQLGRRVRILDLGAGTGQGYELLTQIDPRNLDLGTTHQWILPEERVESYLGLDLDEAMVEKGRALFTDNGQVHFERANLCEGLGSVKESQPPFDIYFSAYGSLSHLKTDDLRRLLLDIGEHGRAGSLVVLDLLGRNSMEWPCYWSAGNETEAWRDYSMSYLYPEEERPAAIERFPLRFWSGSEVEPFVRKLGARQKWRFEIVKQFDRSMMVGRHVDTCEYNLRLKPIRRTVNRLHQDFMRTNLDELCFERATLPPHPDPAVDHFFDELIHSWNTLVDFCHRRLQNDISLADLSEWSTFSTPLQFALMTMDRVIDSIGADWYGDPRANVVEPQLGYALRSLELNLQRGLGTGHGLVVVLRLRKGE